MNPWIRFWLSLGVLLGATLLLWGLWGSPAGSQTRLNFSNANLQGQDLSGQDWRGSSFVSANLQGADLHGANLAGVAFTRKRRKAPPFRGGIKDSVPLRDKAPHVVLSY